MKPVSVLVKWNPRLGCPASMRPGWDQCLEIHIHLSPVLQSVSVVGT